MGKINIALAVTKKCNRNCKFCYLERTDEHFLFQDIIKILDKLQLEHVSITGGEPLLHPELFQIIDWFYSRTK